MPTRMKIGVVSPFMPHDLADILDSESKVRLSSVKGVTATPVTPLVRAWHDQGHTLCVFCLDQSVTEPVHLSGPRITIDVLPKRRFRESMMDCYRTERSLIREAIEREQPDVISAQWSYEHAIAALDTDVPTLVTCHDTPLRYAWISKSVFMTYHLFIAAAVIRRATGLVCVSPYTANHIKKLFFPKCEPQVIPNGLPTEIFLRGERRLKTHRDPHPTYTLCSVGGWGGIKNIKTLLRAYANVRTQHPNIRLLLFGSDLGAGEVAEQWAKAKNLSAGVEFRGRTPREDIFDFLEHEADLMVHPSLVETHGMVLSEAMACGVPVIGGSSSGAVAWTLGDGEYGFLCNIRSVSDLAKTIHSVIEHPEATAKIAARGYASAAERFTMEQTAAMNLSALRAILPNTVAKQ